MPQAFYNYFLMTSFGSMLLVYGRAVGQTEMLDNGGTSAVYRLQVYEAKYNLWTQADGSDILCADEDGVSSPILMQHNGTCYRIMFEWRYIRITNKGFVRRQLPIVHEIVFHKDVNTGMLTVKLGEEMTQDVEVPTNEFDAFQIGGDIFVSCRGLCILKTGKEILKEDLTETVEHRIWEKLENYVGSNVVRFTFDQRLVKQ